MGCGIFTTRFFILMLFKHSLDVFKLSVYDFYKLFAVLKMYKAFEDGISYFIYGEIPKREIIIG